MSNGIVLTPKEYDIFIRMARAFLAQSVITFPRRRKGKYIPLRSGGAAGSVMIAEVDSDATGGGYYNCHLQTLDATDWDSATADQLDDTGDSVVVLNLCEIGTSVHNLDAGDLIACWTMTDDDNNARYVGVEVQGRHDFGEV